MLLSSTLPPSFIPELFDAYNLLPDTVVVRQSTNRPELIYVLEKMGISSLLPRTIAILDEEKQDWNKEDRGLVFVTSIAEGQKLVDLTDHAFYVGDRMKMSDTDWQNAYDRWIQGYKRIMVATTAFCAGNDYPHVQLVIHMDKPFDMLDFCQGQGRAGRDGHTAKCYLLTSKSVGRPVGVSSDDKRDVMMESKVAMYDHVFTYGLKRCLHYGTTLFADGVGLGCQECSDNQLCCVCDGDPHHKPETILIAGMPKSRDRAAGLSKDTSAGMKATLDMISGQGPFSQATTKARQLMSSRQLKNASKVDAMLVALQRLEGICVLCQILDDGCSDVQQHHHLYACPCLGSVGQANSSWDEYKEWRKGLRYVKWHHKICWLCHVPQLNDSLHPTFSKANKGRPDCNFADMVAPTAFGIYHHQALRMAAERHFGQDWASLGGFTHWLMDKPAVGSESNLMDLFMWCSVMYKGDV